MTYMSMQLRDYPADASRETLEKAALATSQTHDLNEYARRCGPYKLKDWAKPKGIELYYVDNCWVRAAVTGRQVQEFFDEILGGEPALSGEIEPDRLYLLECEEF